ncbi:MAG: tetratricopeptide repeat protein [Bacteroidota bacterium]
MKLISTLLGMVICFLVWGQNQSIKQEPQRLDSLLVYANRLISSDPNLAVDTAKYVQNQSIRLGIDSIEANSLRVIGRVFSATNRFDSALFYFMNAKDRYESQGNRTHTAIIDMEIGIIYRQKGEYSKAMDCYLRAETVFKEDKNKVRLGELYRSMAIIKSRENKLKEALQYYLLSEKYAAQIQSFSELAAIQNGISRIFNKQARYDKSLQYLRKALATYQKIGHKMGEASVYTNMGDLYLFLKEYDSVIYYSNLSISNKSPTNYRGLAIPEYNKGLAFLELGQTDSAASSFRRSEYLFDTAGDKKSVIYPKTGLIELYRKEGEFAYALEEAEKTLQDALSVQAADAIRNLYSTLSDIHFSLGNYKEAFLNQDKFHALSDSLLNEETSRQLLELETRYETEKKEQQILSLEQEAKISKLQITQQRFFTIASLSFIAILAMGAVTFYRNRQLKLTKQKLTAEQRLLRSQMNPHFLFNALSSVHSYIYEGDKKRAAEYLSVFSELSRDILDQSAQEFISLERELSTLTNYLELQQTRFPDLNYQINTENIDTESILVPPILMQPFVENSIEHGFKGEKGGNIEINLSDLDQKLCVEILDDGHGFSSKPISNHTSKAINITRERLLLLYKKDAYFTLTVKDRANQKGVVVKIEIPMKRLV